MEILLTLTYVALCYATFKLFRIPVNQWTLATAALGGVFGLALLFITMAYNHPFSTNARIYFTVTPILPSVRGRVIEVPVEDRTNQHLEAGEVLFKIDPKPYEYAVQQKRAGLADAEANVAQLKASVDEARRLLQRRRPNCSLPRKTTTDSLSCSSRTSSRRPHSTRQRAISMRQNRRRQGPLLQKIVRGKRMARPLTVNTRSSCVYAMSLPMLNTI